MKLPRMKVTRPKMPPLNLLVPLLVTFSAALPGICSADDSISADRPDFVNSPDVVGAGRFQIEVGYASQQGPDTSTPLLLRLGAGSALELRLATDGIERSGATHGVGDTTLGLKWHFSDGAAGAAPALALLVNGGFATGSATLRSAGFTPSLQLAAEWELRDDVSLGIMPGVVLERAARRARFATGQFAVSAEKGWSDAFHTFLELAGQRLANRAHGGSVVSLDTGGSYLLNDNLQLDAAYFFGLDRGAPAAAWTAGVSLRF